MSISPALRLQLSTRDGGRCAYCHTTEYNSGQAMHIDHIVPESAGGMTVLENLCQVCFSCNVHKSARQFGIDPQTAVEVAFSFTRCANGGVIISLGMKAVHSFWA